MSEKWRNYIKDPAMRGQMKEISAVAGGLLEFLESRDVSMPHGIAAMALALGIVAGDRAGGPSEEYLENVLQMVASSFRMAVIENGKKK